ncbi:MAG TPA: IPT/TIG domain-containing protein, partial [Ktedonobacterales bacterium]|nr:IPT/TIG domain-containing protein [Ktedonobacterales bacterium]
MEGIEMRTRIGTRNVIRNVSLAALVVACVITGLVYVIPAAAGAGRPGSPAQPAGGHAAKPRIDGVSPATAPAGSTINITGSGFLLTNTVAFGGTSASF